MVKHVNHPQTQQLMMLLLPKEEKMEKVVKRAQRVKISPIGATPPLKWVLG